MLSTRTTVLQPYALYRRWRPIPSTARRHNIRHKLAAAQLEADHCKRKQRNGGGTSSEGVPVFGSRQLKVAEMGGRAPETKVEPQGSAAPHRYHAPKKRGPIRADWHVI